MTKIWVLLGQHLTSRYIWTINERLWCQGISQKVHLATIFIAWCKEFKICRKFKFHDRYFSYQQFRPPGSTILSCLASLPSENRWWDFNFFIFSKNFSFCWSHRHLGPWEALQRSKIIYKPFSFQSYLITNFFYKTRRDFGRLVPTTNCPLLIWIWIFATLGELDFFSSWKIASS